MSKKLKYLWVLFNNIPLLFLISLLLVTLVSYINMFPSGYIFSGADVVQFFRLDKFLYDLRYLWTHSLGEGMFLQYYTYIVYYYVLDILSNLLNFSYSQQSFLYFFVFLFGSFSSFFIGLYLLSSRLQFNNFVKFIFSLIYTFNVYTLYVFYYTWGYSPFLFLYLLVPLLFPLTLLFFENSYPKVNIKYLFYLSCVFFLTNIPNGNFSFFVSLNILTLIYIVLLFYTRTYYYITFLKNTLLFYIVYGLCISWSIVPQLIEMLKFSSAISSGDVSFDFSNWVIWQATKFSELFTVIKLDSFKSLSILNFGGLYYLFLFLFLFSSPTSKNFLKNVYLLLLFICLSLLNKGVGLFYIENINTIFSNPILLSLKSYDKVLVYIPYFILMSLIFCFDVKRLYHKVLLFCLFVFSLAISYPLLIGKIQTKYSSAFNYSEYDYKSADYSYIHKIPEDYFYLASYLNSMDSVGKIFHLPYSVINSIGWVNLSRWGVVGVDPTVQLLDSPSINVNTFNAFGSWNYGKYWNTDVIYSPSWIVKLAGIMGSEYVLYHKDVDSKFYDLTFRKILYLEDKGELRKVLTKENFNLYKIKENYVYSFFYHPNRIFISPNLHETLPAILASHEQGDIYKILMVQEDALSKNTLSDIILDTDIEVSFTKINPVKYVVEVDNLKLKDSKILLPLVFTDAFHYGWVVLPRDASVIGKIASIFKDKLIFDHIEGNGYANLWLLDIKTLCKYTYDCRSDLDKPTSLDIQIVFWPQYVYLVTLIISISTVVILYLVFFYSRISYYANK